VVILIIVLWAAWLRKSHPTWIDVPLLIVSCVSAAVACTYSPSYHLSDQY
jgi:sodium/potassium-transporting ATPase subunit alpha